MDDLAKLIGKRYFAIQQLLWVIQFNQKEGYNDIDQSFREITEEWNTVLRLNRAKIRLLIGESQASEFLNYEDDTRLETPQSLHYSFVRAHQLVVDVGRKKVAIQDAQRAVSHLNYMCSNYLEKLTNDFLSRASSLELLAPASSRRMD